MSELARESLIIGCGYLGRALAARLLERGQRVHGTVRQRSHAEALRHMGVQPVMLEVTRPLSFPALAPALSAETLDVYYLVPPGRTGGVPTPRQVILGGVAHITRQLRQANVRRGVLVSSTAVYGNMAGGRVDADTTPEPNSERGRLLLEGENMWREQAEAGPRWHVVRLAGLYGPGRIVGEKAVREGSPLVGDPEALLNLVHVDDAADLPIAAMAGEKTAAVELGADGHPVARIDYYSELAQRLNAPTPRVVDDPAELRRLGLSPDRLRQGSSKACDPMPTCQRTVWSPRYATFKQGLDTLL
ncbi:MAG: NAD-dependent epimerase/dehydratase family protein [Phycisphaeraceae bacterium]